MPRLFRAGLALTVATAALVYAPLVRAEGATVDPEAHNKVKQVHFVSIDPARVRDLLPPPPEPGSMTTAADLEAVRQAQAWRTPEQVVWAEAVAKFDPFELFGTADLLGPQFTKKNLPAIAQILEDEAEDLRPLSEAAKDLYARPRPFKVDPSIKPCIKLPTSLSYPSAHTYGAFMCAAIFAEIFPEQRDALFARAHRIAWGRVLGGVHYPTDLEGGRRLAEAAAAELVKNPAFKAAVEKCRTEAAAVLQKKAA